MSAVGEGVVRVLRGRPADDEVAALVVALSAVAGEPPSGEGAPGRSRWADRASLVRRPLERGPGAWRASGR
ncbi:acyl-CoA carboxylase subunit epsilon [Actinophytocola gossypii]|uniref:Acyl-CoA carboxylase subunit epsilon n=1 Tax=Actinophytocola gossypii TaxID=2812003 RepID=A0ABT2JE76_9PSEU|nr:acyl-CoA carboxylase subunit epsilon [Actinophytocola gossypii]MCT2586193.1 acyl-CoA carboxylase subunit epsilon [Actinophytocola gossypii]